MFSYVIPIGIFPFFAKACVKNIVDLGGLNLSEIDFVFLCNKGIRPSIQRAFDGLRQESYRFRVLECPYDYGYSHMLLLDWAMRYGGLCKWVVIQHCDLFWSELPRP